MTEFDKLLADIRACRICLDEPERFVLPHEPRPVLQISKTAKILIVGQAPGARVHQSGKPFTDPSGDRLRDWMGIDEDIFYNDQLIAIVPMGFCFPGNDNKGGDLPPRPECPPKWRLQLLRHLEQLELILLVGQYAQRWHLGGLCKPTLSETVFAWSESFEQSTPPILPLPHPSWRNNNWINNNPWFERDVLPVLKSEVERLVK